MKVGKNVKVETHGTILKIEIDMSAEPWPTSERSSGKYELLASTGGIKECSENHDELRLNLTLMRRKS